MVENMLQDISSANDFNATCLRYFNAAGAHESGAIGEAHDPETHLIPNVLKAHLNESNLKYLGMIILRPMVPVFEIMCMSQTLLRAHLLGLEYMQNNNGFFAFNLGNGDGFSVLEVIKAVKKSLILKSNFKLMA